MIDSVVVAVDALQQEWDPRLKALIGDASPRAAERLAALALRAIDPAVRAATTAHLSHLTAADRADVATMCRDRLTALLRAVQKGERTVPVPDLDDFARLAAEGMCRDYLRRTRPALARLANRIRLIATRGVGIVGWTTPKGQPVLGLPVWTDRVPIEPPYPWAGRARDWWGKGHAALDGPALAPTVARVLEQAGGPVPTDAVAAAIVEITGSVDPGARVDASPEGDEPELSVLDAGVGPDHLAIARRYLERAWQELLTMPPQMRASLLLSLRDHHGAALLPVFHCAGVTPLRLVADALAMKPDETAAIWAHLPWDDKAIGRRLGLTGLQVLNARTLARSRLLKHMAQRDPA